MNLFLTELVNVAIYSVLGIILMLLGSFIVDLAIPCSFPEEIKKGNKAIGFISAGAYIAIGLIIRVAISSIAFFSSGSTSIRFCMV